MPDNQNKPQSLQDLLKSSFAPQRSTQDILDPLGLFKGTQERTKISDPLGDFLALGKKRVEEARRAALERAKARAQRTQGIQDGQAKVEGQLAPLRNKQSDLQSRIRSHIQGRESAKTFKQIESWDKKIEKFRTDLRGVNKEITSLTDVFFGEEVNFIKEDVSAQYLSIVKINSKQVAPTSTETVQQWRSRLSLEAKQVFVAFDTLIDKRDRLVQILESGNLSPEARQGLDDELSRVKDLVRMGDEASINKQSQARAAQFDWKFLTQEEKQDRLIDQERTRRSQLNSTLGERARNKVIETAGRTTLGLAGTAEAIGVPGAEAWRKWEWEGNQAHAANMLFPEDQTMFDQTVGVLTFMLPSIVLSPAAASVGFTLGGVKVARWAGLAGDATYNAVTQAGNSYAYNKEVNNYDDEKARSIFFKQYGAEIAVSMALGRLGAFATPHPGLGGSLRKVALTMPTEAGQEMFQQANQNWAEGRELGEGVVEAGKMGFIFAALLGSPGIAVDVMLGKRNVKDVDPQALSNDVENLVSFIDQLEMSPDKSSDTADAIFLEGYSPDLKEGTAVNSTFQEMGLKEYVEQVQGTDWNEYVEKTNKVLFRPGSYVDPDTRVTFDEQTKFFSIVDKTMENAGDRFSSTVPFLSSVLGKAREQGRSWVSSEEAVRSLNDELNVFSNIDTFEAGIVDSNLYSLTEVDNELMISTAGADVVSATQEFGFVPSSVKAESLLTALEQLRTNPLGGGKDIFPQDIHHVLKKNGLLHSGKDWVQQRLIFKEDGSIDLDATIQKAQAVSEFASLINESGALDIANGIDRIINEAVFLYLDENPGIDLYDGIAVEDIASRFTRAIGRAYPVGFGPDTLNKIDKFSVGTEQVDKDAIASVLRDHDEVAEAISAAVNKDGKLTYKDALLKDLNAQGDRKDKVKERIEKEIPRMYNDLVSQGFTADKVNAIAAALWKVGVQNAEYAWNGFAAAIGKGADKFRRTFMTEFKRAYVDLEERLGNSLDKSEQIPGTDASGPARQVIRTSTSTPSRPNSSRPAENYRNPEFRIRKGEEAIDRVIKILEDLETKDDADAASVKARIAQLKGLRGKPVIGFKSGMLEAKELENDWMTKSNAMQELGNTASMLYNTFVSLYPEIGYTVNHLVLVVDSGTSKYSPRTGVFEIGMLGTQDTNALLKKIAHETKHAAGFQGGTPDSIGVINYFILDKGEALARTAEAGVDVGDVEQQLNELTFQLDQEVDVTSEGMRGSIEGIDRLVALARDAKDFTSDDFVFQSVGPGHGIFGGHQGPIGPIDPNKKDLIDKTQDWVKETPRNILDGFRYYVTDDLIKLRRFEDETVVGINKVELERLQTQVLSQARADKQSAGPLSDARVKTIKKSVEQEFNKKGSAKINRGSLPDRLKVESNANLATRANVLIKSFLERGRIGLDGKAPMTKKIQLDQVQGPLEESKPLRPLNTIVVDIAGGLGMEKYDKISRIVGDRVTLGDAERPLQLGRQGFGAGLGMEGSDVFNDLIEAGVTATDVQAWFNLSSEIEQNLAHLKDWARINPLMPISEMVRAVTSLPGLDLYWEQTDAHQFSKIQRFVDMAVRHKMATDVYKGVLEGAMLSVGQDLNSRPARITNDTGMAPVFMGELSDLVEIVQVDLRHDNFNPSNPNLAKEDRDLIEHVEGKTSRFSGAKDIRGPGTQFWNVESAPDDILLGSIKSMVQKVENLGDRKKWVTRVVQLPVGADSPGGPVHNKFFVFKMDPMLFRAISKMNPQHTRGFTKLIAMMKRLYNGGTTGNPLFAPVGLAQDTIDGLLKGLNPFTAVWATLSRNSGITLVPGEKPLSMKQLDQLFEQSGGKQGLNQLRDMDVQRFYTSQTINSIVNEHTGIQRLMGVRPVNAVGEIIKTGIGFEAQKTPKGKTLGEIYDILNLWWDAPGTHTENVVRLNMFRQVMKSGPRKAEIKELNTALKEWGELKVKERQGVITTKESELLDMRGTLLKGIGDRHAVQETVSDILFTEGERGTDEEVVKGRVDRARESIIAGMMQDSAQQAGDLMNYSRTGAVTREAGALISYFPLGPQGFDAALRSFKKSPARFGTTAVMLLMGGKLLEMWKWRDDEDYANLSEYVKNTSFVWDKDEDGVFLTFPVPREFGIAFFKSTREFIGEEISELNVSPVHKAKLLHSAAEERNDRIFGLDQEMAEYLTETVKEILPSQPIPVPLANLSTILLRGGTGAEVNLVWNSYISKERGEETGFAGESAADFFNWMDENFGEGTSQKMYTDKFGEAIVGNTFGVYSVKLEKGLESMLGKEFNQTWEELILSRFYSRPREGSLVSTEGGKVTIPSGKESIGEYEFPRTSMAPRKSTKNLADQIFEEGYNRGLPFDPFDVTARFDPKSHDILELTPEQTKELIQNWQRMMPDKAAVDKALKEQNKGLPG